MLPLRWLSVRIKMNVPTVESGELRKDSRQRLGQYRRASLLTSHSWDNFYPGMNEKSKIINLSGSPFILVIETEVSFDE